MKKVLKIIGIMFLGLIILLTIVIIINSNKQEVPVNYEEELKTGGEIETKYLKKGKYETAYYEEKSNDKKTGKYLIHYPKELELNDKKYPVIVFNNGSGVTGSRYKYLFSKWASWGFIVLGNQDTSTWSGESADKTLSFLIEKSKDKDSIFYNKVDLNNIGVSGHSQGGVGTINSVTAQGNSSMYKTLVALSPIHESLCNDLNWHYDISKINIPTLFISGGKGTEETEQYVPQDKLEVMYEKIKAPKAMARRVDAEHLDTDSFADGYVTAWFMWQLQGNEEASKAFIGDNPEIMQNEFYQDKKIDLSN